MGAVAIVGQTILFNTLERLWFGGRLSLSTKLHLENIAYCLAIV